MKKMLLIATALLFLGASNSTAIGLNEAAGHFGIGAVNGYGPAGCGWGTDLWKQSKGEMPNIMASITNGLSSNQAFGMSSGTLGCNAVGAVASIEDKKAVSFVAINYDDLSLQMSRGQGEQLAAFTQLLGCPAEASEELRKKLKGSYGKVFLENAHPAEILINSKSIIQSDLALSAKCTL